MVGMGGSRCPACGRHVQPGTGFCTGCGQPVAAAAGATPPPTQMDYPPQGYTPQGYPPPPSSESRLPYPPPGGQAPPGLPPAGQPPYYGAPVEQEMSDTQRMLQPQGLFRGSSQFGEYQFSDQGEFGPPPWPGGPDGMGNGPGTGTLPRGMHGLPGGPGAPGGPMGGPRRSRRLAPIVIAGALAVVVVIAIVASTRGSGGGTPASTGTTAGSTPSTSASASASASKQAEKRAATKLAALLPQSGKDRTAVVSAYGNVQGCKMLPQAVATFGTAAKNRQTLLSSLATLPGRSALPAALLSALKQAWQASVQADTDYAKWANDAIAHCKKGNPKDPNLKASFGPDSQATNGKTAFVKLWNPIASKFGLNTYTVGQL
jgi:hypothetical protein